MNAIFQIEHTVFFVSMNEIYIGVNVFVLSFLSEVLVQAGSKHQFELFHFRSKNLFFLIHFKISKFFVFIVFLTNKLFRFVFYLYLSFFVFYEIFLWMNFLYSFLLWFYNLSSFSFWIQKISSNWNLWPSKVLNWCRFTKTRSQHSKTKTRCLLPTISINRRSLFYQRF